MYNLAGKIFNLMYKFSKILTKNLQLSSVVGINALIVNPLITELIFR